MAVEDTNDAEGKRETGHVPPMITIPVVTGIEALLGGRAPLDWADPIATAKRRTKLEDTAVAAGAAIIECLLHLPVERRLGRDLLRDGGPVLSASDAVVELHKVARAYRYGTLRGDERDVARSAIEREHGKGVADLVLNALNGVREMLRRETTANMEP